MVFLGDVCAADVAAIANETLLYPFIRRWSRPPSQQDITA